MKRHLLFLTVGLLTLTGNVFASLSQTFTHITPGSPIPYVDNFTLTSFDTALGTLQSITISLVTTGNANVDLINLTGQPQAFSNATASLPLTLSGPAGINVATSTNAGPFAGTIGSGVGPYNFAGPTTTSSASVNVASGLFSSFETVGPVNLSFSAGAGSGSFAGSAQGGVFFGGSGNISGVTSITYTYDAPTPEPALLGVLSLGLCGIFLIRGKRLKKS